MLSFGDQVWYTLGKDPHPKVVQRVQGKCVRCVAHCSLLSLHPLQAEPRTGHERTISPWKTTRSKMGWARHLLLQKISKVCGRMPDSLSCSRCVCHCLYGNCLHVVHAVSVYISTLIHTRSKYIIYDVLYAFILHDTTCISSIS